MPFSVYDPSAVKLLSAVLADVMLIANSSVDPTPSESDLRKRLADNLMRAFDRGERDPLVLKRVALDGMHLSADKS